MDAQAYERKLEHLRSRVAPGVGGVFEDNKDEILNLAPLILRIPLKLAWFFTDKIGEIIALGVALLLLDVIVDWSVGELVDFAAEHRRRRDVKRQAARQG